MNPWNLSELEVKVLTAVIEHGSDKAAARALGVGPVSVRCAAERVRKKMKCHTHAAIVKWTEWRLSLGHSLDAAVIAAARQQARAELLAEIARIEP